MHRPEITGSKVGTPKDDLSCLSFREMAIVLGVDEETLRLMHEEGGDAAPPRFRISPKRWGYPIYKYREWLEHRMKAQAAEAQHERLATKPRRKRDEASANNEATT